MKTCLTTGIGKAWSGFIWMLKIIIPVSMITVLVDYAGFFESINFFLEPVMTFFRLPPVAALPLVVGLLTGIYGGIAAMTMLPLSNGQMTLIAVFLLISHNLIQEGIVQARTGLNFLSATLVRLIASVITVLIIAQFMGPETLPAVPEVIGSSVSIPIDTVLKNWFWAALLLCVKMWIIMTVLMIFLEILKYFNAIRHIVGAMRPVLKILGLDETVGVLWLTAVLFGITYGAAVIVEDARAGSFETTGLKKLHISIGINHAMLEDPFLFMALGINPLLLWLPRLAVAMAATHLFSMWQRLTLDRISF